MKRWLWSLAGGVVIPTSYFFGVALLEGYAAPSSRKALQLPFAWPRLIYFHFAPPDPSSPYFNDTFDPILFLFIIICNLAVYSLFVYVVLWVIAARKPKIATL
jgi:hypothetical protein